jgi:hypothetical protein
MAFQNTALGFWQIWRERCDQWWLAALTVNTNSVTILGSIQRVSKRSVGYVVVVLLILGAADYVELALI